MKEQWWIVMPCWKLCTNSRVHLSVGVQVGGVLEPIKQSPVIIEDDAFIGAGSVIVEGIQIKKNAIIAPE